MKNIIFISLWISFSAIAQETPNSPTSFTSPEQLAKQKNQSIHQEQYHQSLALVRDAWGGFGTLGVEQMGLSTVYRKILKEDWYVLGETGLFHRFNSEDVVLHSLRGISPKYNVYMIPLFIGIRKNLIHRPFGEIFLPFFIAGMGPVVGLEFSNSNQFFPHTTGALTWGAYMGGGADLFLFYGWQTNLNFRYQYTEFDRSLGPWTHFSSWLIVFGFEKRFF